MADKAVLWTVKSMNDSFDLQRFVDAQIFSSEYASYSPYSFPTPPSDAAVRERSTLCATPWPVGRHSPIRCCSLQDELKQRWAPRSSIRYNLLRADPGALVSVLYAVQEFQCEPRDSVDSFRRSKSARRKDGASATRAHAKPQTCLPPVGATAQVKKAIEPATRKSLPCDSGPERM